MSDGAEGDFHSHHRIGQQLGLQFKAEASKRIGLLDDVLYSFFNCWIIDILLSGLGLDDSGGLCYLLLETNTLNDVLLEFIHESKKLVRCFNN